MSIVDEREKTHGDFEETARLTQALRATYRTSKNWPYLSDAHREALDQDACKTARILSGNPNCMDHWKDKSGYSELGWRACK